MYDTPLTIEQILNVLAAAPSRLADLTKGLPPAQLVASPAPGEWSARDVLAHLRACSDTAQRADLLALLKPLAPAAWSRAATVTGAGKPRERTVHTYAQWLANHERTHLRQIERLETALRA